MKNAIMLAVVAGTIGAFAGTSVESKPVGFVIRDAATEDATKPVRELVAVPFAGLDGAAIKVADVLASTELAEGDSLYAFDKANDRYNAWKYGGTAWEPTKTLVKDANGRFAAEGPDTELTEIPAGTAVWLERADATKPVVLVGRKAETPAPEVGAGWNLCCNAGVEKVAVSNLNGVVSGDIVIVPTVGAPIRYAKKDGEWGFNKETTTVDSHGEHTSVAWTTEDAAIPAGQGFWLVREEN